MKSDYSLGELKKQKDVPNFPKKSSQVEFEFFDSMLPYENKTSLFYRLSSIRNTKLIYFVA